MTNVVAISSLEPPRKVDLGTWRCVQQFMLRHCGVVLRDDQIYLAESRLTPARKAHGFADVAAFVATACSGAPGTALAKSLIDAMTTHETSFFRDGPFWQTFESVVLPKLARLARKGESPRIWSAACSTGQEPYSIAMLIDEYARDVADKIEIVATDVSDLAINRAKSGVFTALEVNRYLNASRMMKYFTHAPGGFLVREELRNRIRFQAHNLLGANPDPSMCEAVLCRNVLIYFGELDRAAALRRLQSAAKLGGYIALGSTEVWREGNAVAPGFYQKSG